MSPNRPKNPPAERAHATLGALFRAKRESLGLPVEKAAHETKIRAARLREIEADDLSRIQPAYARMFVRDYGRYLQISEAEIGPFLPESGEFGVEGYEYIRNAPGNGVAAQVVRPRARGYRRRRILKLAALLVAAAVGFQIWVTIKKLERIHGSGLARTEDQALLGESSVPASDAGRQGDIETFRAVGETEPTPSLADGVAEGTSPAAPDLRGASHF